MELKTLISESELKKRIKELADEINNSYSENEPVIAICVLKGAVMFYAELVKYLKMPINMEFVKLSSYGASMKSSGKISMENINLPSLENKKVLIIEDIIDSGLTLKFLIDYIKTKYKACDVKLVVMFNKKHARKFDFEPNFSAFDVDNKFIVGFGLDFDEKYRNLPYIGYIEE